jgi:hypothetical protein
MVTACLGDGRNLPTSGLQRPQTLRTATAVNCGRRLWRAITQVRIAARRDICGRPVNCGSCWCAIGAERSAVSSGIVPTAPLRVAQGRRPASPAPTRMVSAPPTATAVSKASPNTRSGRPGVESAAPSRAAAAAGDGHAARCRILARPPRSDAHWSATASQAHARLRPIALRPLRSGRATLGLGRRAQPGRAAVAARLDRRRAGGPHIWFMRWDP